MSEKLPLKNNHATKRNIKKILIMIDKNVDLPKREYESILSTCFIYMTMQEKAKVLKDMSWRFPEYIGWAIFRTVTNGNVTEDHPFYLYYSDLDMELQRCIAQAPGYDYRNELQTYIRLNIPTYSKICEEVRELLAKKSVLDANDLLRYMEMRG